MSDHAWVHENLDVYLAGGLSADDSGKVDRHLAGCDACQQELAQTRQLSNVMDRLFSGSRPDANLENRMVKSVQSAQPTPRKKPGALRFFAAAAAVVLIGIVGAIVQAATEGRLPFASTRGEKGNMAIALWEKEKAQVAKSIRPAGGEGAMSVPEEDTNYFNDRIANITVPGAVNPNEGIAVFDGVSKLKDASEKLQEKHKLEAGYFAGNGKLTGGVSAGDPSKGPMQSMPAIPGMGMSGMGFNMPPALTVPPTDGRGLGRGGAIDPSKDKGKETAEFYGRKFDSPEAGDKATGKNQQRGFFETPKGDIKDLATGERPGKDPASEKPGESKAKLGDQREGGKGLLTPPAPVPTPVASYFNPQKPADPSSPVAPPVLPVRTTTPASQPGQPGNGEGEGKQGQVEPTKKPPLKLPEQAPEIDTGRKIIRTGDMEFEIDSFYNSIDTIGGLLRKLTKGRGFIATTNSDKLPNGKMRGSIVVRMPPEYLDDFLKDLRESFAKTGELKSQRIGSQDVTKAYTDTESELRAARAVEGRLIEIIKTGKGEIKDLIAAERELGVWRTKIEKMEGEIRYYNNQVSLSTVTITLYEKEIQAASAIVITEKVGMRIEVDDVAAALDTALQAVADAKGRVTKSELKQHSALQLEAILHAEISPSAKDAFSAKLAGLGIISHKDSQRLQQSEGGTGKPLDLKFRTSDVRFEIAIHDLVNVRPRHTASLQVAANDVPEQFNKLRDEILKIKGQIRVGQVNEQDKLNITAQLDFNVPSAAKGPFDKLIASIGLVLSRNNIQAPVTELSTDRKVGYSLVIRDFASVPPLQALSLNIATADVPALFQKLQDSVKAAKGHVRTSQLNEQDKQNINAHVDFSVMSADKKAIDELLEGKQLEATRTILSRNNLQAANGSLATAEKFGYSVTLRDFASIAPSKATEVTVSAKDVAGDYARLLEAVKTSKGHVGQNELNERDRNNVSAVVRFTIPSSEKPAIDKVLAEIGVTLSRNNVQAPVSELSTDRKFGYSVHLRDFASIPPSKATERTIAVSDVAANYARLLDMVKSSKGHVGQNELNERDKLNVTAVIRFTIPSTEKPPLDKVLTEMGTTLSGNNVQAPVNELSTDQKFGYSIILRDFASIPPRETFTLQLAATDVQVSFRELQEAVTQARGLVHAAQVIENNKINISAKFDFNISAGERAAIEKAIAKVSAVLSRASSQVPVNELATDQKVGFQLVLHSTAAIPPREVVMVKLEVKDVDAKAADLKSLIVAGKGRVVNATVNRQENGKATGDLQFEVPLASAETLVRQIKAEGTLVSQTTTRTPNVPDNELATARINVTLTGAGRIVPDDESFGSYVNSSLYLSFRIFSYGIMIIIIGISTILPWTLVLWVVYKLYTRMTARTVELVPAPQPTGSQQTAGETGTEPSAKA